MDIVDKYNWNPFSQGVKKYINFLEALERLKIKLNYNANDCEIENCAWEISVYNKYDPSKHVLSWGYVDDSIFSDKDFKLVKDEGKQFGFIIQIIK